MNGVVRTLSRIDRDFINILVDEARDFHCYSHVFENVEKRSIPSDLAAVRVVFSETDCSGTPGQTNSELDVQTTRRDDDVQYLADPFGALADFKIVLEKKQKGKTVLDISRKTLDSPGAQIQNEALRHAHATLRATLLQASLGKTFQNEKQRQGTSLGRRRRKTMLWQSVGLDFEHGAPRNLCFVSHAVTDEDGHPLQKDV